MADSQPVERLLMLARDLEMDLEGRAEALDRHARGAAALVRALALIMGVLALANLWFVYDLTQEVRLVIAGMDEMRSHFARVSDRMSEIRESTAAMDDNTRLMPVIAAQMRQLGSDMERMRRAVADMTGSIAAVDRRMDVLNRDLTDMTLRFRSLNHSVGAMGDHVNQMGRPLP